MIHEQCFQDQNTSYSQNFIHKLLKNPNSLLVEEPKKGFCIASLVKGEAEIITMAVAPKYQRLGVGRLILSQLMNELQQRNCKTIFLEVSSNNLVAHKLYFKEDFVLCGIRKNYYQSGQNQFLDAWILEKRFQ